MQIELSRGRGGGSFVNLLSYGVRGPVLEPSSRHVDFRDMLPSRDMAEILFNRREILKSAQPTQIKLRLLFFHPNYECHCCWTMCSWVHLLQLLSTTLVAFYLEYFRFFPSNTLFLMKV